MEKKVIIGIVAKHGITKVSKPDTLIRDEMKDAIFYNNAIAIGILPSTSELKFVNQENEQYVSNNIETLLTEKEKQDLINQINLCDGIILSGGLNSDIYEIWVGKYCHENDIPIIAICAGQNNLTRAIGGSIKNVSNPSLHDQPEAEYVHEIKINENTKFYNFVKTKNFKVNSRHKNVIDNPANLIISATDTDGNIEVVEDPTKKCFIGMRFHPESLYLIDENHNNIFKTFINICKNK